MLPFKKAKQKRHTHTHTYVQTYARVRKNKTKKRAESLDRDKLLSHPSRYVTLISPRHRRRPVSPRIKCSLTSLGVTRKAPRACVRRSRSRLLSRLSSPQSEECERRRRRILTLPTPPVSHAIDIENILQLMQLELITSRKFIVCTACHMGSRLRKSIRATRRERKKKKITGRGFFVLSLKLTFRE